jgi:hypothetical protein
MRFTPDELRPDGDPPNGETGQRSGGIHPAAPQGDGPTRSVREQRGRSATVTRVRWIVTTDNGPELEVGGP